MIYIISKNNIAIRISDERLRHISNNHPETFGENKKITETVEDPDIILEGDFGELLAVRKYDKTPISENKYLIVVYKEISSNDGFILTAYFSRKISKRRKILWKR